MKKIIMICPASSQPRYHKRATSLNKYFNLKVYAFKRKVYEGNKFDNNLEYVDLGYIEDGKYLARVSKIISTAWKIRKEESSDAYFYALSLDCLIIAKLAGLKKGFLEIGDLRIADTNSMLMKMLDSYLIRLVSGVVLTSKYFFTNYYQRLGVDEEKFFVIENRLPAETKRIVKQPMLDKKRMKIGLIGLLRYEKPIKALIALVQKYPDKFVLECYGDGRYKYLLTEAKSESIRYHGEFIYPDDLAKIYSNVDLSYTVYDTGSKNVCLALPNKLYESAFFGVPILCSSNTALASEVNKLGIGIDVDVNDEYEFEQALLAIGHTKINQWISNAKEIDSTRLIDNSDKVISQFLALKT